MATAKVNGSNYTTQPNIKGSGAVNNRGVAARIGTSAQFANVKVSRFNTGVFASTVLDNSWSDKALSAGTFGYNNLKPIAKRTTDVLSGVGNSVLRSGSGRPSLIRSVHKLEVLRTLRLTTAIRSNKYNRVTGAWESGFPVSAVDSLNTDTAATPTRANPGQLTYKGGNPRPVVNNDYKSKTN